MNIEHRHVEITITKYEKACPYCSVRTIKRKTCGSLECQYKHHILSMRSYPRKTDKRCPTRTISTTQLS